MQNLHARTQPNQADDSLESTMILWHESVNAVEAELDKHELCDWQPIDLEKLREAGL
jgi:hypothetical protein